MEVKERLNMGCLKGCAGFFVGAMIIGGLSNALGENWLGKTIAAIVILGTLAIAIIATYQKRKLTNARKFNPVNLLRDVLFETKLPEDIAAKAAASSLLAFDDAFKWRVVRSADYAENFETILREYEGRDGEVIEDFEAQLVCEPANTLNPNAIAVTWGGLIIGYMAKLETPSLFAYIMNMGGMAQARGRLTFGIADNTNTVRLDIAMPYSLAQGR
jgi:hypothetical protein